MLKTIHHKFIKYFEFFYAMFWLAIYDAGIGNPICRERKDKILTQFLHYLHKKYNLFSNNKDIDRIWAYIKEESK